MPRYTTCTCTMYSVSQDSKTLIRLQGQGVCVCTPLSTPPRDRFDLLIDDKETDGRRKGCERERLRDMYEEDDERDEMEETWVRRKISRVILPYREGAPQGTLVG